jgi:hypothetical protein
VPREVDRLVPLDGLVLSDARTDRAVDLGGLPGHYLLTAIRHRF